MKRLKFFPDKWQIRFLAGLAEGNCSLSVWPVKPQPKFTTHEGHLMVVDDGVLLHPDLYFNGNAPHEKGDKVWVAEVWAKDHHGYFAPDACIYKAKNDVGDPSKISWRSPTTMPFYHSRIHLEVLRLECKLVSEMTYQEAGQTGIASDMPQYPNVDYLALKMFKDYWLSRYGKDAGDWYAWVMKTRRMEYPLDFR